VSEEYTHLLLTRFNTPLDYSPSPQRLESEWLLPRLSLFERYCLASVKAQTGVTFHWLVFCDAASPGWFRDRMAAYEPILKPIYISGPATDAVLAAVVKSSGLVRSRYLITTRVDNDDALATDHLLSVQKVFRYQKREFVSFPFGLQLYRGALYNVYWRSNPFLSLIERVGDESELTTVFCVSHDKVGRLENVRYVRRRPQWLQVLHTSNVGNRLRGWPKLDATHHPGFAMQWEGGPNDPLFQRIAFSAEGYVARLERMSEKIRLSLKGSLVRS
jgi:Putative rhamnosyl transferase